MPEEEGGQPPSQKARAHAPVGLVTPPGFNGANASSTPATATPATATPDVAPSAPATPLVMPSGAPLGRPRSETPDEVADYYLQEVVNNCSYEDELR